jgi:hypothetical protein
MRILIEVRRPAPERSLIYEGGNRLQATISDMAPSRRYTSEYGIMFQ